ncbi:hypothetical protein BDY19DRAFT_604899 [Irpex rosettiformis]|uniref:Uncharacterized protein n=1 Tax=Irpex rosettiformis TaxID=378272 RepID=A0ACB8TPK0_9APHY|nr:hypothetical protein BDY19DRAFT_604899 [Irpex rosettiformis]
MPIASLKILRRNMVSNTDKNTKSKNGLFHWLTRLRHRRVPRDTSSSITQENDTIGGVSVSLSEQAKSSITPANHPNPSSSTVLPHDVPSPSQTQAAAGQAVGVENSEVASRGTQSPNTPIITTDSGSMANIPAHIDANMVVDPAPLSTPNIGLSPPAGSTSSALDSSGILLLSQGTGVDPAGSQDIPTTSDNLSPSSTSTSVVASAGSVPAAFAELGPVADKAEEIINGDAEKASNFDSLKDGLKEGMELLKSYDTVLDAKNTASKILSHVEGFLKEDPWFMRALDDVAKIHPFVSVAVIAFKACYNMELARRQNDKRVIALFKEMKDMIEVLTRLLEIKDPNVLGPNGDTIKGRMQKSVALAEADIKECGNTCDTWMKKNVLTKVLVGVAWEGKLAGFMPRFAARRLEFDFALQIHTATKVDAIEFISQQMSEKLDGLSGQFAEAFRQMRTVEETRVSRIVEDEGGIDVVHKNEDILRRLFDTQKQTIESLAQRVQYSYDRFKVDLDGDFDGLQASLENNFKSFEGKFNLYQEQLKTTLHEYMKEESDRVITEVSKGPHDLIRNPELKQIWQEMHWRRNVKARHFVMTLQDHFTDGVEHRNAGSFMSTPVDDWTIRYINVTYLLPIMDAIDDDATGRVSISELNRFTDQLPATLGWGLTHWIAYWAIGWQTFTHRYREIILQTYTRMFGIRKRILPENRNPVDIYLTTTWKIVYDLTCSLRAPATAIPKFAEEKFEEYIRHDETRMQENLAAIKYKIDATDTIYAVLGPGRIEKRVLPLLFLLLQRDEALFQLATQVKLGVKELQRASRSIVQVKHAVRSRYEDLVAQFDQQRLDVSKQLKNISCELFTYYHDFSGGERLSELPAYTEDSSPVPEKPTSEKSPPANFYPTQSVNTFAYEAYDPVPDDFTESDLDSFHVVGPFLGQWNGYTHNNDGMAITSMVSFFMHATARRGEVTAYGYRGEDHFTITASVTEEDNIPTLRGSVHYSNSNYKDFSGQLQADGSIAGSVDEHSWEFYFPGARRPPNRFHWMRIPAELMLIRPLPPYIVYDERDKYVRPNKARALFKYACRAVIMQIRKRSWAWAYFRERRDNRLQCMAYWTKVATNGSDSITILREQHNALRSLTQNDLQFWRSVWAYYWDILPQHVSFCDVCRANCRGARYVCLDCIENATERARPGQTVDFCSVRCAKTSIYSNPSAVKAPHTPDHDIMKFTTFVHTYRDLSRVRKQASYAVKILRQAFPVVQSVTLLKNQDNQGSSSSLQSGSPSGNVLKTAPSAKGDPVRCGICRKALALPCWICAQCSRSDGGKSLYICDGCEDNSLLRCTTCSTVFKQPQWYYGTKPRDTFQCATCIGGRVRPKPLGNAPHTYLHHLVHCHTKEVLIKEPTTEERLVTVEQKVDGLDTRMTKLEAYLERIERKLEPGGVSEPSLASG